jgi:hypothetical protein
MVAIKTSLTRVAGASVAVALTLFPAGAVLAQSRSPVDAAPPASSITIVIHESAPTEATAVADARIDITDGKAAGQTFSSNEDGRTVLPPVDLPLALAIHKSGYESARVSLTAEPPNGQLEVALSPEVGEVRVRRGGSDSCSELPAPPEGLRGLREYARLPVHHDGILTVTSAQLPFFSNPGFVYRQTATGWVKNEVDYVLLRSPIPLQGGFVYLITFGGDREQCGAWSIDLTHPK